MRERHWTWAHCSIPGGERRTKPRDVCHNGGVSVTQEQSAGQVPPDSRAAQQVTGSSPVRAGSRVVIIGGGPGGYEAALVARQLGAEVTVVEAHGMGGAAVLTDVVPSKTLIATAEWMTLTESAAELGIHAGDGAPSVRLDEVNARVRSLAAQQERDIATRLEREGIEIVVGRGRLGEITRGGGSRVVHVDPDGGEAYDLEAEMVLIATGATPRELPDARPDGERILTWKQLYGLTGPPEAFAKVIRDEHDSWKAVIQRAGIKAE